MVSDEEVLRDSKLSKKEKCDLLIKNNIGLFKKEAARFSTNGVCDTEDYQQEAYLNLIEYIVDNWNPDSGVKFVTYLTTCIRNAIRKQAHRFHGPFTVSSKTKFLMIKVGFLIDRGFTFPDIIRILNISEETLKNIKFLLNLTRIDDNFEESIEEIPINLIVEEANLTDKEKQVIDLRQKYTLKKVGEIIGCSDEWVRKIEEEAIRKVKKVL